MTYYDLRDLLNMPVDNAAAPLTIPVGDWVFEIDDVSVYPEKNGKAGGVLFRLRPVEALDADGEEVAEFVEDGLDNKVVFHRHQLRNQGDVWQLNKLLKNIGADTTGKSAKAAAQETVGLKIVATVNHDANAQNPEQPWVRLRGFGPAPTEAE